MVQEHEKVDNKQAYTLGVQAVSNRHLDQRKGPEFQFHSLQPLTLDRCAMMLTATTPHRLLKKKKETNKYCEIDDMLRNYTEEERF